MINMSSIVIYQNEDDIFRGTVDAYNAIVDGDDVSDYIFIYANGDIIADTNDVTIRGMIGHYMYTADGLPYSHNDLLYAVSQRSSKINLRGEPKAGMRVINMSADRPTRDDNDKNLIEYFVEKIMYVCSNISSIQDNYYVPVNTHMMLRNSVHAEVESVCKCISDKETDAYIRLIDAVLFDTGMGVLSIPFLTSQMIPDLLHMILEITT